MRVELAPPPPPEDALAQAELIHQNPETGENEMAASRLPSGTIRSSMGQAVNSNDPDSWGKVGRNDVCPCGSGKKFKHCHGSWFKLNPRFRVKAQKLAV